MYLHNLLLASEVLSNAISIKICEITLNLMKKVLQKCVLVKVYITTSACCRLADKWASCLFDLCLAAEVALFFISSSADLNLFLTSLSS